MIKVARAKTALVLLGLLAAQAGALSNAVCLAKGTAKNTKSTDSAKSTVDTPVNYALFTFPTPAVAEILCATEVRTKDGRVATRWDRVMAAGTVRLPTNSLLQINVRFDGLEKMQTLDCLKQCRVSQFSAATLDFEDRHMKYLKAFKDLQIVDFEDTLITDASLPFLGSLKKLIALRLLKTNITGVGFDHLKNLTLLKELKLEGSDIKPGTIFKLKSLMPQLTSLDIARISITKEDTAILKSLKSAKFLNLSTNKNIDNNSIKYLSGLNDLRSLALDDTSVTDKCLPDLLKLPSLCYVVVRGKTFWTTKKHKNMIGKILFEDCEATSNAPPEVFTPLH